MIVLTPVIAVSAAVGALSDEADTAPAVTPASVDVPLTLSVPLAPTLAAFTSASVDVPPTLSVVPIVAPAVVVIVLNVGSGVGGGGYALPLIVVTPVSVEMAAEVADTLVAVTELAPTVLAVMAPSVVAPVTFNVPLTLALLALTPAKVVAPPTDSVVPIDAPAVVVTVVNVGFAGNDAGGGYATPLIVLTPVMAVNAAVDAFTDVALTPASVLVPLTLSVVALAPPSVLLPLTLRVDALSAPENAPDVAVTAPSVVVPVTISPASKLALPDTVSVPVLVLAAVSAPDAVIVVAVTSCSVDDPVTSNVAVAMLGANVAVTWSSCPWKMSPRTMCGRTCPDMEIYGEPMVYGGTYPFGAQLARWVCA